MTFALIAALVAPLALQATPAPQTDSPPDAPPSEAFSSFDDLPIEQSAAPRCGLAFAVVADWQRNADPRGGDFPDMEEEGGREFFVRTMANLMEQQDLTREALSVVLEREFGFLSSPQGGEQVQAMMPACLLMKEAAGL